ncbi:GAF domain-containing protein [Mucilaginibacter ginkgonis]|uniref:GAF domain-containing protein n=1 Tax=Mucilaginibacter ginkgonis TaxID=2682091 RepID=A0A7T7FBC6_9SPHI|nr:GAF domain-containing protein [Mucilaginibacter ginkgonis]QQL50241.1 GAF domain-containing protein [Mucilaginibacter ginkgonis]
MQTVNRFLKLQISKEAELQKIVEHAALICSAPIALITFMDDQLQHVKFSVGTDLEQINYNHSFCQQTIRQDEVFAVADASVDPYFAENPFVKNEPHIRFYAGAPLITNEGDTIGTVCVYDVKAKTLSDIQRRMLKSLSNQVMHLLEFDASLQLLKEQYVASRNMAITLHSFFESSSSNHVLLDLEMRIVAYNKAFDEFTVNTQGKHLVTGTLLVDYLHMDFRSDYVAAVQKALAGEKVNLEKDLQYGNRRICWYMIFEPAYDRDQQIVGVSFNRIDITARVEQEELVKNQNKSLRKIRKVELHDLEQPAQEIVRLMSEVQNSSIKPELEEVQLLAEAVKELQEKMTA